MEIYVTRKSVYNYSEKDTEPFSEAFQNIKITVEDTFTPEEKDQLTKFVSAKIRNEYREFINEEEKRPEGKLNHTKILEVDEEHEVSKVIEDFSSDSEGSSVMEKGTPKKAD